MIMLLLLLLRRPSVGIDQLVALLLSIVVHRSCTRNSGAGEFDWLTELGIEEDFWRWRAQS